MNSIFKLSIFLFVVASGLATQSNSLAERIDPAPLASEIIDGVRRTTNTGLPSFVSLKIIVDMNQIKGEIEKEQESEKHGKRKHGEGSPRMKSVLATKAVEMQFTRDEVLRQFDKQEAKLRGLGLSSRIGALEAQRSAFNARFTQLDEAMKRADKAGKKDYEQEIADLAALAKAMSPNQREPIFKPSDAPPHFSISRRRPREEPLHSIPPAYTIPRSGHKQVLANAMSPSPSFLNNGSQPGQKVTISPPLLHLAMNDYVISSLDTGELAGFGADMTETDPLWPANFDARPFILAAMFVPIEF